MDSGPFEQPCYDMSIVQDDSRGNVMSISLKPIFVLCVRMYTQSAVPPIALKLEKRHYSKSAGSVLTHHVT